MADRAPGKRKAEGGNNSSNKAKKQKYSKFKSTNRGADNSLSSTTTIENGSSGIWATCVRGLEAKATAQLRDVLDEYAELMYPDAIASKRAKSEDGDDRDGDDNGKDDDNEDDIEAALKAEVNDAKNERHTRLFKTVRIDIACVLYFVVEPPIDAVALVHRICSDAAAGKATKRTRHINRLTPMTLMGRASLEGIEAVASKVLAPHFHTEGSKGKTFAIRPSIRNHDDLTRTQVIDKIAALVGNDHTVNLSRPDLVILVDIYKTRCGMSVVDGSYERLKRFNLNELYASSRAQVGNEPEKKEDAAAEDDKSRSRPDSGSDLKPSESNAQLEQ